MKLSRHVFQLLMTSCLVYLAHKHYMLGNMPAFSGWLFSIMATMLLWIKEIEEAKYRDILDILLELGEYYENEEGD